MVDVPVAQSLEYIIADRMSSLTNDKKFKAFQENLRLECRLSPRGVWLKLIGYVAARMLEDAFGK